MLSAFNLLLKPVGPACNLNCSYCYYLGKEAMYPDPRKCMDDALARKIIRSYIQSVDTGEVCFYWHGGEPLLAGLPFYLKVLEWQTEFSDGKTIRNFLQTNGTLLSEEWGDFLARNNFLVGVSLDGPASVHDRYRMDRGGYPTLSRVLQGISVLRKSGVEWNTISTVNKASEGRGRDVYRFLKSIGSHYMQFIPVLEYVLPGEDNRHLVVPPTRKDGVLAPWSVDPVAYGQFMCDVFDSWKEDGDRGSFFVDAFDAALAAWCGYPPASCIHAQTCGTNPVVEYNGDLFLCDHFVYPEFQLGNIRQGNLRDMMQSLQPFSFGANKRAALPSDCRKCRYLFACNGGCPKHRFAKTATGESGLNALCDGYRLFFSHIAADMQQMKSVLILSSMGKSL